MGSSMTIYWTEYGYTRPSPGDELSWEDIASMVVAMVAYAEERLHLPDVTAASIADHVAPMTMRESWPIYEVRIAVMVMAEVSLRLAYEEWSDGEEAA